MKILQSVWIVIINFLNSFYTVFQQSALKWVQMKLLDCDKNWKGRNSSTYLISSTNFSKKILKNIFLLILATIYHNGRYERYLWMKFPGQNSKCQKQVRSFFPINTAFNFWPINVPGFSTLKTIKFMKSWSNILPVIISHFYLGSGFSWI